MRHILDRFGQKNDRPLRMFVDSPSPAKLIHLGHLTLNKLYYDDKLVHNGAQRQQTPRIGKHHRSTFVSFLTDRTQKDGTASASCFFILHWGTVVVPT
jgi:hypothetical protein